MEYDEFVDHLVSYLGFDAPEKEFDLLTVETLLMHLCEVFDDNGDGCITLKEAFAGFALLRSAGSGDVNMCDAVFTLIDRDASGEIDCDELATYILAIMKVSGALRVSTVREIASPYGAQSITNPLSWAKRLGS